MSTHRHRWEGIDAHAGQRYQDDADTDQRHDLGVEEDEKAWNASLVLLQLPKKYFNSAITAGIPNLWMLASSTPWYA